MDDKSLVKFDCTTYFGRFRTKMLRFGALIMGFDQAFTQDLDIYAGSANEAKNKASRVEAWSYLMIALDGAALQSVDNITSQNPYEAWELLTKKHDPADIEAYARLNQEFNFC